VYPQDQSTPYWAYVLNPPNDPPPADPTPLHVPNSSASFTFAETQDYFRVADWNPNAHPPMPPIVALGRKPDVYACAFCHLPNGQGKPENSSLAGLPVAYLVQQMADFKSGARKSSEPKHIPVATMIAKEDNATPAEIQSAAKYFSSLKYQPWIRVVETKDVPITHAAHFMLVATPGAGREPIGHRIIEMAEHPERTELRDDAAPFVAYVPIGSLRDGQSLVAGRSKGGSFACRTCHGANLGGFANVPSIAGRSPSYIVRQLLDMQSGARAGPLAKFMQPVVSHLTLDEIIAIAAYLAALRPSWRTKTPQVDQSTRVPWHSVFAGGVFALRVLRMP
jgi:cytochrome c553